MSARHLGSVALFAVILGAAVRADDLTTVAGKKHAGKLVAVDKAGVTFQTGGLPTRFAGKELMAVDLGRPVPSPAKDAKFHEVQLTDGSTFRVARFAVKGKALAVEPTAGPAGVPPPAYALTIGSVFTVMRGAEDAKARDDWRRMLQNRGKRDLYVIRQADGLNFLAGTILEGSADGTTLKFEKESGGVDELRLSRATGGLVFAPPPPAAVPPTVCKVVDVFGNVLTARAVDLAGTGMTVTTVCGVEVRYPDLAAVSKLDYAQGNLAYLSDLPVQLDAPGPGEAEEKAFAQLKGATGTGTYQADKVPSEAGVVMDGVAYPKGVRLGAFAVAAYQLGGDYREFKAVIGPQNPTAGALKVTIEADGRAIATETVRGADKPKPLALDVKGVNQLRILVDADTPGAALDYVILADARVQK